MNSSPILLPGDILLFRGGSWISRAIRWFEKRPGNPADVNHAGIVARPGNIRSAVIVEALTRVERHTLGSQYGGSTTEVEIYRAIELTDAQRLDIAAQADAMVGKLYNYGMIVLQAVDGLLGKLFRREVIFARRLSTTRLGPICSVVVAVAYQKVTGWTFGAPADAVDPDDIQDYCVAHPAKYQLVWGPARIPAAEPVNRSSICLMT